ncbi:hypothetical protein PUN28_002769 [Cardiocondyla obscurior]|uniref:Uncharacterized protein n=1 Tax=Cardiocondyla obscurior TaxID=286306 RepID=A0AAW2GWA2_9HYME
MSSSSLSFVSRQRYNYAVMLRSRVNRPTERVSLTFSSKTVYANLYRVSRSASARGRNSDDQNEERKGEGAEKKYGHDSLGDSRVNPSLKIHERVPLISYLHLQAHLVSDFSFLAYIRRHPLPLFLTGALRHPGQDSFSSFVRDRSVVKQKVRTATLRNYGVIQMIEKKKKIYVRTDYPTILWILYIMIMFKRYSQLLLKMLFSPEESTLENFPRELLSFIILSSFNTLYTTTAFLTQKIKYLLKKNFFLIKIV